MILICKHAYFRHANLEYGFKSARAVPHGALFYLHNMGCTGYEENIFQCPHIEWGMTGNCTGVNAATVFCFNATSWCSFQHITFRRTS